VGSVAVNNFSSVSAFLENTSAALWDFENSVLVGPPQVGTLQYYRKIYSDVSGKSDAGFEITITDYW
jgi:lysophospholipase